MSASGKIVFVLGMHRSGTSVTAELVSNLGYVVPGSSLDKIGAINGRGFWESKEVVDINERLLATARLKWFHVCPVGHFLKAVSPDVLQEISYEIREFIAKEIKLHGGLVIKDPRLCILLPVWLDAIKGSDYETKTIYINRHPATVASSLRERDGFSLFSGHLLWMHYFFSVFDRQEKGEILYLTYEGLLADHSQGVALSDFLSADYMSETKWSETVDHSLRRNFDTDFPDNGYVYNLAKDAYTAFSHGSVLNGADSIIYFSQGFESFVFKNNDFVYALNESNNNISGLRANINAIGDMHTYALNVVKEKDDAIARLSADMSNLHGGLQENAAYISECEGRIFNLEFSLSGYTALRKRVHDLENALSLKDSELSKKITEIDEKTTELTAASRALDILRQKIKQLELLLEQKSKELADDKKKILAAEERIFDLDSLFVSQRENYLSALEVVDDLERKVSSKNEEFFLLADDLTAAQERLDSLLSSKIVRMVDRYKSKGGVRGD